MPTRDGALQAWRRLPHPIRWLGVAIVGGVFIVLGLVMLVTPGPGIAFLVLGLLVLATEFAWAEILLRKVKERSKAAADAARSRMSRRSGGVAPSAELPPTASADQS